MRFTQAFIPTVKEVPKDAVDASHVLLLRGGFIRMIGAGIYEMLPLGQRVLTKVSNIIRDEMNEASAQEVLMPTLLPASYFKETGRWDVYGDVLVRIKDRRGGHYHLAPTHEEIVTDMVRREVKSYKQLPLNLYQVQWKFRDEPRPRAGLMRCREFLMKDAYSFDSSLENAEKSYAIMRDAYHRIFGRLGLTYRIVEADSGQIGGDTSAEFQVLAQSGEDHIVACGSCDYAANVEVAEAAVDAGAADASGTPAMEKIATPDTRTIEEVLKFFGGETTIDATLKSLLYVALAPLPEDEDSKKKKKKRPEPEEPKLAKALVVVRGDHEVNEIKVARAMAATGVRLATEEEVRETFGVGLGSLGPVAAPADLRVLVDHAVAHVADGICGANEDGHHLRHVAFGRDFEGERAALRMVGEGDACPRCNGVLSSYRGIEGGHIFILGTHYSSKMNATFLDENGKAKPFVMGCYGIGVTRLMAAAIEQHHDDHGIRWPMAIAPYQVTVLTLGKDAAVKEAAEKIYDALKKRRVEVLFDDRKDRPGSKFKDADLIGVPLRVAIGARGLEEGMAELKERASDDAESIPLDEIVDVVVARIEQQLASEG